MQGLGRANHTVGCSGLGSVGTHWSSAVSFGFSTARLLTWKRQNSSLEFNGKGRDWAPLNDSSDAERHPTFPSPNTCTWFFGQADPWYSNLWENGPNLQGCYEDYKKCFVNQTHLGITRLNTCEIRHRDKRHTAFHCRLLAFLQCFVSTVHFCVEMQRWVNLVVNPNGSPKKKA